MNYFQALSEIEEKEYLPGFHGKMIHLNGFTLALWRIEAGAILPEHHHVHEQVTNLLAGKMEMTVNGVTQICEPGIIVKIPSNVVHAGKAVTECQVLDVFQPRREDYE